MKDYNEAQKAPHPIHIYNRRQWNKQQDWGSRSVSLYMKASLRKDHVATVYAAELQGITMAAGMTCELITQDPQITSINIYR